MQLNRFCEIFQVSFVHAYKKARLIIAKTCIQKLASFESLILIFSADKHL